MKNKLREKMLSGEKTKGKFPPLHRENARKYKISIPCAFHIAGTEIFCF